MGNIENNLFLPGMEPENLVKMIDGPKNQWIDLRQFDLIVLCVSGGKDSHAMLFYVAEMARDQGVYDRLIAIYNDTGMEWKITAPHVKMLCDSIEIKHKKLKPKVKLIDYIANRVEKVGNGFPCASCRYCTSKSKTDPTRQFIRQKKSGFVLQITGERKQESKERAKMVNFGLIPEASSKYRSVFGWRPMLEYTEADIWAMVKKSGAPPHFAYSAGADRLGCAGCVFSSHNDLRIEAKYNPEIIEKQIQLETDSGYRIRLGGKTVKEIIN